MPDFGFRGSGPGDGMDYDGCQGMGGERGDGQDDGGRQKRCWKTANYEWMNIKRKPGNASKSKGNTSYKRNLSLTNCVVR